MEAANFRYRHAQGAIYGYITDMGVRTLLLPHPERPLKPYVLHSAPNSVVGHRLAEALEAYFAGIPQSFEQIPLDLSGGTDFQREVWLGAMQTPYGHTSSYGDLTKCIGKPITSARAVGAALGANPLAILVPCHRFIAANGKLVNFAAGLEWKRTLLELEGSLLSTASA